MPRSSVHGRLGDRLARSEATDQVDDRAQRRVRLGARCADRPRDVGGVGQVGLDDLRARPARPAACRARRRASRSSAKAATTARPSPPVPPVINAGAVHGPDATGRSPAWHRRAFSVRSRIYFSADGRAPTQRRTGADCVLLVRERELRTNPTEAIPAARARRSHRPVSAASGTASPTSPRVQNGAAVRVQGRYAVTRATDPRSRSVAARRAPDELDYAALIDGPPRRRRRWRPTCAS